MSDNADRILAHDDRDAAPVPPPPDEGRVARNNLPTSRHKATAIERAQRTRRIVALATGGASPARIADVLGVKVGVVHSALVKAVNEGARSPIRDIDAVRELSLQRLDAALLAIWPKVQEGNLRAIDRALAIEKQRAKLAGLDREVEGKQANHLHLHGVTEEDVATLTSAWVDGIQAEPEPPADADVVDDEEGNDALEALAALPSADEPQERVE